MPSAPVHEQRVCVAGTILAIELVGGASSELRNGWWCFVGTWLARKVLDGAGEAFRGGRRVDELRNRGISA